MIAFCSSQLLYVNSDFLFSVLLPLSVQFFFCVFFVTKNA